jgi:hypothetical protein
VKEREQRRADLSGEEGGEDESGAPVGAGEERWRRPLDLRREEVCSHGPCTVDLRRERRGEGDGEGAGGGWRQEEETEGRGRQWNRVWGSFYTKQTQF